MRTEPTIAGQDGHLPHLAQTISFGFKLSTKENKKIVKRLRGRMNLLWSLNNTVK